MKFHIVIVTKSAVASRLLAVYLESSETASLITRTSAPYECLHYALSESDDRADVIILDIALDRTEVTKTLEAIDKAKPEKNPKIFFLVTPEDISSMHEIFHGGATCIIVHETSLSRIATVAMYCQAYSKSLG